MRPKTIVQRVKNAADILLDWLGDGGAPVDAELADERSKVCEPCPQNNASGDWISKAVSGRILKHLRVKHELGLSVANESKIGTCNECGCHLPLKVWTPLKHISENTSTEELKAFPAHCWIRKEML